MHSDQVLAVGRPVRAGIGDALQHLPGNTAGHRDPRKHSQVLTAAVHVIQQDRHLARSGNGKNVGCVASEIERPRLRALEARQVEPGRLPHPCRAIEDRLAVGRETRVLDEAAAKGQPVKRRGGGSGFPAENRRENRPGESPQEEERRTRYDWDKTLRADRRGQQPFGAARNLRDVVSDALQVPREISRRGVPLLRVLGHASLDDPSQRQRRLRTELAKRLGLLPDDGRHRFGRGLLRERFLPRRDLVEDRAERELVGTEIEWLSARLLRRHIAHRTHNGSRVGLGPGQGRHGGQPARFRLRELRQAEVEDLDESVPGDHHVLGLQVAVDDPRRVRLREPRGDLRSDADGAPDREGLGGGKLPQRSSVHQLHRYVGRGTRLADLVDRDDVGMVQGRGGAGLLLEARQPIRVERDLLGQDFQSHLAAEPGVPRPVHLSHSPRAERSEDLVGTKPGARR